VARAVSDLLHIADEEVFKRRLADDYHIASGDPNFDGILTIWREYQRGRL
jgi:hypothetical protein